MVRAGGAAGTGAEISLQPVERPQQNRYPAYSNHREDPTPEQGDIF